jgi:hypothetical protein
MPEDVVGGEFGFRANEVLRRHEPALSQTVEARERGVRGVDSGINDTDDDAGSIAERQSRLVAVYAGDTLVQGEAGRFKTSGGEKNQKKNDGAEGGGTRQFAKSTSIRLLFVSRAA